MGRPRGRAPWRASTVPVATAWARTTSACAAGPAAWGASSAEDEHEAPTSGLLVFVRDGEPRYEEPALCARCGMAIGVTAMVRWAEEEEEG